MWLITSIFCCMQFFFGETVFSSMVNQIMKDFQIGTALAGLLSSCFCLVLFIINIPAGIILDKFDIKYVITISSATFGIGCIMFGLSPNFYVACLSRIIMGFGASFAFIGVIKNITLWYKTRQFSLMLSLEELMVWIVSAFVIGGATFFIDNIWVARKYGASGFIVLLFSVCSYLYLKQPEKTIKSSKQKLTIKNNFKYLLKINRAGY